MITHLLRHRDLKELLFASIAFFVCVGVSAHAALRAIEATADLPDTQPAPIGYETQEHFPGAALLYTADADAAPSTGTTGTIMLPDMPVPQTAIADVADGSVIAARAFSMAAASGTDRARALECLADAVYYEAASESDAGQRAVAQVVLNRVAHPAFPHTVCGVVFQGSERTSGCQFSFACDGAMARGRAPAAWTRALRIAGAALGGYVFAPVGLATHYHTYAVTPAWNRKLVMTDAIGAHLFHRWSGWWGTPAAFSDRYAGGEPVPAPHPRPLPTIAPATPLDAQVLASLAAQATAAPAQPTASVAAALAPQIALSLVQPAYADSGTVRTAYSASAASAPENQILDKWKDSGTPLR